MWNAYIITHQNQIGLIKTACNLKVSSERLKVNLDNSLI